MRFKDELVEKLEEAIRLIKEEKVSLYEENISYIPISINGVITDYLPTNYTVTFSIPDEITQRPVKFTIQTEVT